MPRGTREPTLTNPWVLQRKLYNDDRETMILNTEMIQWKEYFIKRREKCVTLDETYVEKN